MLQYMLQGQYIITNQHVILFSWHHHVLYIYLLKKDEQEGFTILMYIFNYFLEYLHEERASKFEDTNNIHSSVKSSIPMWKQFCVCSSQTYIARSEGGLLQEMPCV